MESIKCFSCGLAVANYFVRVHGAGPDGRARSWLCRDCADRRPLTVASPDKPRMVGKAPIKFTTVLRAERLANAGHGATADEVLRNALDVLEHAGLAR